MGKKEELLSSYQRNASENDCKIIDKKIHKMNTGKIKEIWSSVQALYKMVGDPNAAWTSKAMAIGSLIYLVSPIDAVPDVIPVLGLTDDATVIVATVSALALELKKYMIEYEREKAEIQKNINSEIQAERYRYELDIQLQKQKAKEKFIIKIIVALGIFATLSTLIIKAL